MITGLNSETIFYFYYYYGILYRKYENGSTIDVIVPLVCELQSERANVVSLAPRLDVGRRDERGWMSSYSEFVRESVGEGCRRIYRYAT